jgi:cysteinyl-tRNA synthetase
VSNQLQPSPATAVEGPHEEIVGNLLEELELLLVANRGKDAAPNETREKITAIMQELVNYRAQARKAKNFALGDKIRKRLSELQVTLEDRPGETVWRIG